MAVMSVFAGRVLAAAAALCVGMLGGCGSSSDDHTGHPSTSATASATLTPHGDDDVAFLQNMLLHQQQALELSMLVSAHSTDAALIAFATQIANETNPQIQGLRAQLLQWEIAPSQGGSRPQGMVDAATVDKLKSLSGSAFDTLWLQSMLAHHRGALATAQYEIAHGQSADVISMATTIGTSQQSEIDQMNRMLGG